VKFNFALSGFVFPFGYGITSDENSKNFVFLKNGFVPKPGMERGFFLPLMRKSKFLAEKMDDFRNQPGTSFALSFI